ncbi:helix-turn-helix domain-containing protein [Treponema phagedenis]|uniref:helix-turn-helix domain-containing protein n=1 Tax=Treponema phagedenis TaxID=162 RepID=UPI001981AE5E|nr:helix-turn-helix domain-containing protein [Treponema phagedenis]QSH95771.1 helix-turn-helix domain-containing protein [Treponema phagedenis]
MQDIGELLKIAREEKQIELEQAARETNIAKRYLEALETDEYSVFPGEPYILGFLRNYCEYLGLNADQFVTRYKQVKIQETSLPPEALLPQKKISIPKPFIKALIVCIILAIIGGCGYFIFLKISRHPKSKGEREKTSEVIATKREPAVYTIKEEKFEKQVFVGDTLLITAGETEYKVVVEKTSPDLYLDTPIGTQIIKLGESSLMDFNMDVHPDVQFSVEDIDIHNEKNGALIQVRTGKSIETHTDQSAITAQTDLTVSDQTGSAAGVKYKVLFEAGYAYPVTMNATFRGYCLFRFEVDKSRREERYYQKNEQLTVQANNGIRIWASNGNAVKLQIVAGGKTVDIEVSKPGEVIVKDLKWIKDDDGRFKFVVMDID